MGAAHVAAVADSSVLILLGRIGRLDLLGHMFHDVSMPPAVERETVAATPHRFDAQTIRAAIARGGIRVAVPPPAQVQRIRAAYPELGDGEAEALSLARPPTVVLLDDRFARQVAQLEGVEAIGTLGILGRAFQAGLVDRDECQRLLEQLLRNGLWVSGELVEAFWRALGGRPSSEPSRHRT